LSRYDAEILDLEQTLRLAMATVKLEIDTDTGLREGGLKSSMPTEKLLQKPMILASTIKLNSRLRDAFETGAGQRPLYYDGIDYDQIKQKIQVVDGPNRLIVTAGGLIAFEAAKQYATISNFVSLVGAEPSGNIGNCYGGVTLKSFDANSARVDFLVEKKGRARAAIGLFCNPNSPITQKEVQNWQTIPGVNQTVAYGGNTGGHNDSSHYLGELNAADGGIATLIISADPFFQDTKEKLIKAANDWVAARPAGTRYICYPLADYENVNGTPPTPNTASWYGPRLSEAYGLLGTCAAIALTATSPLPFSNTTDTWGSF
jgi:hypothetical protein